MFFKDIDDEFDYSLCFKRFNKVLSEGELENIASLEQTKKIIPRLCC